MKQMRNLITLELALSAGMSFCLAGGINAQPPELREPEYVGAVFWLQATDGALAPLERQTPSSRMKIRALGYGGGRMVTSIKGSRSPVRLSAEQQVFVVRFESGGLDPALMVGLDVLKASKNTREATVVSVGPMGFGSKTAAGEATIQLTFEKYGEHSFKVHPAAPLAHGEYMIRTKATGEVAYLFGVD